MASSFNLNTLPDPTSADQAHKQPDPAEVEKFYLRFMRRIRWTERSFISREDAYHSAWLKILSTTSLQSILDNDAIAANGISQTVVDLDRYLKRNVRDYRKTQPLPEEDGSSPETELDSAPLSYHPVEQPPGVEESVTNKLRTEQIEAALRKLPLDQQQVIRLRFYGDESLSRPEVAKRLNLPTPYKVELLEKEALRNLRSHLAGWGNSDKAQT